MGFDAGDLVYRAGSGSSTVGSVFKHYGVVFADEQRVIALTNSGNVREEKIYIPG